LHKLEKNHRKNHIREDQMGKTKCRDNEQRKGDKLPYKVVGLVVKHHSWYDDKGHKAENDEQVTEEKVEPKEDQL
jgi:hypothetical protein